MIDVLYNFSLDSTSRRRRDICNFRSSSSFDALISRNNINEIISYSIDRQILVLSTRSRLIASSKNHLLAQIMHYIVLIHMFLIMYRKIIYKRLSLSRVRHASHRENLNVAVTHQMLLISFEEIFEE